jgi:hypothetical protein
MDAIQQALSQAVEQLLGRASGPLHFRLILQPMVAAFLAFKAGKRDAAAGEPAFLWELFTRPEERSRLLRSAWKDIGKILIVALVLDTAYQLLVFRSFHVVQALIVGLVLAILPYALLRGPITRLLRGRDLGDRR